MNTLWCRIFGHSFVSHVRWASVVLVCQACGKVVHLNETQNTDTKAES